MQVLGVGIIMKINSGVKIHGDKLSESEYIIKDHDNINIGRFSIIDLNKLSKRCDIKLHFYKEDEYVLLKDSLSLILKAVFKDMNIFKVNVRVCEFINVKSFLDLGFTLEGIFSQNEYYNGEYVDEMSFGITSEEYSQSERYHLIEIQGDNVYLRNLNPGDAQELAGYYIKNKKHLEPFEPTRDNSFYTVEGQMDILNESYKQLLNGTSIDLGIFKDGKLIGKVKLSNIVYGSLKSGILGYSIDKDEQGKGYMKESVNLITNYAFEECNLHRLEASTLLGNERSKNVLLSCGFKLLGMNKKYLLIDGKWNDHNTYYILKEDFYNLA